MRSNGLLTSGNDRALTLTARGEQVYGGLAQTVSGITEQLWGDLPAADVAATRRILGEVTRRARGRLEG